MQEQQVTMDGTTRPLPRPFLVLATQNPIEYEGTFPLPEAQLDRFLMRITIGYPAVDDERILFTRLQYEHPINKLGQVANPDELLSHQRAIHDIYVDPTLQDYILNLISASRNHADLILGGSPRASLALFKAAQAYAAICGRDHVLPEDIKYLTVPTLIHRIIIRPESELRGKTTRMILTEILKDSVLPIGSKSRPE
jgi:MoxR-like ATPase